MLVLNCFCYVLQERYWELEDMDDEADSSQSDSGSRPEPLDAEVASHSMEMLLEEYVTVQNHLVSLYQYRPH